MSRGRSGNLSSTSSVIAAARSRSATHAPAPLCAIALWNSPRGRESASSVPTLLAPADSPKIVTSSGLPPNPAMLSRTHSSAATWSRMPALPDPASAGPNAVGEVQEARAVRAGS